MNIKFLLISFLLLVFFLNPLIGQENDSLYTDSDEGISLGTQTIKIKPTAPFIDLKMKKFKPKTYTFFRSFNDEVKDVPNQIFEIELDKDSEEQIDISEVLEKKRK